MSGVQFWGWTSQVWGQEMSLKYCSFGWTIFLKGDVLYSWALPFFSELKRKKKQQKTVYTDKTCKTHEEKGGHNSVSHKTKEKKPKDMLLTKECFHWNWQLIKFAKVYRQTNKELYREAQEETCCCIRLENITKASVKGLDSSDPHLDRLRKNGGNSK